MWWTRISEGQRVEPTSLKGGPAALIYGTEGAIIGAVFVEPSTDSRAALIWWVCNPAKLSALRQT